MKDKKTAQQENTIAFFDFDHTITWRDSFLDFLLYTIGIPRLILSSVILIPVICAYMIKIITNEKAKSIVLSFFFKGMTKEKFHALGDVYSSKKLPAIVMEDALQRIRWHKKQGHRVVIISASLRCWLGGWCRTEKVELICSEMETNKGILTGRFNGKNCYGPEKLRRIKEQYDIKNAYIYAYGDSRGDREMLEMADEKFFRHFER